MIRQFAFKQDSSMPVSTSNRRGMLARAGLLAMAGFLTTSQPGCLGVYANLMHAVGADKVPAAYDELEDSSVAIITVTNSSHYSDDTSARLLSRMVGDILTNEVDDIELVREDKVQQWRDTNGWDSLDYQGLGRDVKADKVVSIELTDLTLREGKTLFRGNASATIAVIDVTSGNTVYRRSLDDFSFPTNAGQHTSETTEARFRKLYLGMLAKQIARSFHAWDMTEDFAIDGTIASQ
ncbi:hypothetical protein [Planctomycetes bacterium K23_9]|uniref:Curli production assembly/transport component CsgG n=1 Tax=Stieleria marina TaxID=1930275 RepID=A0A517NYX9_9BACT|nr:hypothetical protein K239x_43390 [Planctomycetes bacterium K23_9]